MPDYKPNQIVRAFAVMALIAAFILVVVVDRDLRREAPAAVTTATRRRPASARPAGGPCGGASGSSIPATPWARSR